MQWGCTWHWEEGMVGDGCQVGDGDEDGGVDAGELNGTQPDRDHRVMGGDGMRWG